MWSTSCLHDEAGAVETFFEVTPPGIQAAGYQYHRRFHYIRRCPLQRAIGHERNSIAPREVQRGIHGERQL